MTRDEYLDVGFGPIGLFLLEAGTFDFMSLICIVVNLTNSNNYVSYLLRLVTIRYLLHAWLIACFASHVITYLIIHAYRGSDITMLHHVQDLGVIPYLICELLI